MDQLHAKVTQNVTIGGRRTSLRLEAILQHALIDVSRRQGVTVHEFCENARRRFPSYGLTGAVRCSLVEYYWDSLRRLEQF